MVVESGNGLASEEKKILLERYGYDADEFLSQASPKVPSLFLKFCIKKLLNIVSFCEFYFIFWVPFSVECGQLVQEGKGTAKNRKRAARITRRT